MIQPVLGTMTFSDQTDKSTAQAMLKSFTNHGFSLIGIF
jgi:aryl-alcohol dehydrogenase-like predicted oxidoreductase